MPVVQIVTSFEIVLIGGGLQIDHLPPFDAVVRPIKFSAAWVPESTSGHI